MSKKKDYEPQDIAYPEQKIVEIDLEHEMQTAYMDYAMSVIVSRAIPENNVKIGFRTSAIPVFFYTFVLL